VYVIESAIWYMVCDTALNLGQVCSVFKKPCLFTVSSTAVSFTGFKLYMHWYMGASRHIGQGALAPPLQNVVNCFLCCKYCKSLNKRRVSIKHRVPNKCRVTGGYDGIYGNLLIPYRHVLK